MYIKQVPLKKENYCPISLLPHVSTIFEHMLYTEINNYMKSKLTKYITGFFKSHETQHSLMIMLEKWKNVLNKGEDVCVLFMDLSKAFNKLIKIFYWQKQELIDFLIAH